MPRVRPVAVHGDSVHSMPNVQASTEPEEPGLPPAVREDPMTGGVDLADRQGETSGLNRKLNYDDSASPQSGLRIFASGYLTLQGIGTLVWWAALTLVPAWREWFTASGAPTATLWAFLPADIVLISGASLVSAWGLAFRRRWGWPILCVQAGASLYAGLYCMQLWLLDPSTWRALVLMVPVLVIPAGLAWLLRPAAYRG